MVDLTGEYEAPNDEEEEVEEEKAENTMRTFRRRKIRHSS